jgi:sugar phosphate isomerase/epimerase
VDAFLKEYRVVGLTTLELNGRVWQHVIDDLMPYIERGDIRISSLHNFCPRPEILDQIDLRLSSPDEVVRGLAVQHTQHTIATAHRLGAKAVVLHAGEILPLRPLVTRMKELYRAGQQQSKEFIHIRENLLTRRDQERHPYVQAAEKSIAELTSYIARTDVDIKLGLETRDYYGQIPQIDEYDTWFARYDGAPIGLWYDFGHGAILENLGLGDPSTLFQRHGQRLLGLHLHDCRGIQDHIVPGTGDIDFAFVRPYLRPDVLRVLEYGRRVQPITRIREGIEYLTEAGIL